jgi:lipopolysaccharide heptosyltransferase II
MTRILVVLPNWFGETLFATPFLRLLRAQQPRAFLATLGRPACREILLHNPAVDELIDLDGQGAHRGAASAWRLLRALRARRFDTAFILRRSLSRTALLALAGIRERVGFDNPKSGWLLTRRLPAPPPQPVHKALSYLPLLGADASRSSGASLDYTVTEDERPQARALLEEAGPGSGPFVILHPGANWDHKRWPAERFAQLGDRLVAARRARIVITGAPEDTALAASVRQAMRTSSAVLAGRTSLRQLAACLEGADLLVSNDTGVLHLAAALKRPLVALYGPTAPALTGPLGDSARIAVLHHPDCCPRIPCLHPERGPAHLGMASIPVEEAYAAACTLLNRHG